MYVTTSGPCRMSENEIGAPILYHLWYKLSQLSAFLCQLGNSTPEYIASWLTVFYPQHQSKHIELELQISISPFSPSSLFVSYPVAFTTSSSTPHSLGSMVTVPFTRLPTLVWSSTLSGVTLR